MATRHGSEENSCEGTERSEALRRSRALYNRADRLGDTDEAEALRQQAIALRDRWGL